jgi:hypothetical protein
MKIRNGASERLLEKGLEEREIGKRARRRSEMGLEKLAMTMGLEKERPERDRQRSEMRLENEPLRGYCQRPEERLENKVKAKKRVLTEL